ncbi:hypothetical protein PSY81_23565, partial [Shigella flexneri]|nr:hypothetical protein [Shigella flexneri]
MSPIRLGGKREKLLLSVTLFDNHKQATKTMKLVIFSHTLLLYPLPLSLSLFSTVKKGPPLFYFSTTTTSIAIITKSKPIMKLQSSSP